MRLEKDDEVLVKKDGSLIQAVVCEVDPMMATILVLIDGQRVQVPAADVEASPPSAPPPKKAKVRSLCLDNFPRCVVDRIHLSVDSSPSCICRSQLSSGTVCTVQIKCS